jgi:hypothetical protein
MGKQYWIGRQQSAIGMAQAASDAEIRLIHYELAGRYSLKAAAIPAFMLPRKAPATRGERAALHAPACLLPPSRPGPERPAESGGTRS